MTELTRRVLALDLRPRSIGFVVFEGPDRLLDWGVRSLCSLSGGRVNASERFVPLLHEFQPSVILLNSKLWKRKETSAQLASILGAIRVEGKDRIGVRLISPKQIRQMFPESRNKDDLASRVAARFPDLAWKLPPRRKLWQREHYRMSIFDAAALALAYYGPAADEDRTAA